MLRQTPTDLRESARSAAETVLVYLVGVAFLAAMFAVGVLVLAAVGWVGLLLRRGALAFPLPLVADAIGVALIVAAVAGLVVWVNMVFHVVFEEVRMRWWC